MYEYTRNVTNKLDDRAYVLAMLSWALTQRRTKDMLGRASKKKDPDWINKIPIRQGESSKYFS